MSFVICHVLYALKSKFYIALICYIKIIQVDCLKKRYDAMQAASKKSGSVLYFKPLRVELNNCFGALKDVTPDQVFSNRKGLEKNSSENNSESEQTSSNGDDGETNKRKPRKSK